MIAPHETVDILVRVSIDAGIAPAVEYLNAIPGVYTFTSCQGGETYGPYVMAWYPPSVEPEILKRFTIGERGNGWTYLHPLEGVAARREGR